MADDQVKYSDLIADDVVKGLEVLNQALQDIKTTMAGVKSEAASLGIAIKTVSTATREQQQATAQNAANVERLSKKMKDLSEEERKVEEIKRRYKKLTDEQIQAVNAFQQALRGNTASILAAVNAIDVENKSYNELNAMYNTLKDSLNAMTVAERQNTEAGKAMTAQSAKIYDTMNELQKATGKYTLQVGKYRAAFDGLGYSFQQILREAPSALNLNQFFLAISNNVPMFLDQLKAFKTEQAEIKANLAQMTEGTAEYAEQLKKVESVGKKLGKTLLSWQTLVLVGLMIIRNWEKIVNLFQKLFNKVEDNLASLRKMRQVVNEIDASVESSISKIVVELGELTNRLDDVTQGSVEWKNITERINEIMGDNYDLTGKMPGQIKQITAAYIAQAEQLAKNQFVVQKISENADKAFKRQRAIETILQGGDVKSAAKIFGYEEGSDEYKALERAANTSMPLPSQTDANEKIWEVVDGKPRRVGYDKWMTDQLNRTFDELDGELFTSQDLQKLWDKYYKAMPEGKGDDGKEPKDPKDPRVSGSFNNSFNGPTQADVLVAEAKAMKDKGDDALAEIQMWYDKKVAIANASYAKELENLQKGRADKNKSLTENVNEAKIFVAKYNNILDQLDKDHAAGNLNDDEWQAQKDKLKDQYDEANDIIKSESVERQRIKDYYDNMEKVAEEAHLNEMLDLRKQYGDKLFKEEQKRFKAHQDAEKRRFELDKHNSIERAKFDMEQEIASKNWQIVHAKDLKLSEEELAILKEEVEWLEKKYSQGKYNAKRGNTGNYSNIMDVLFGENLTSDQISALNSVFDQAKAALNSWMDARKAAADQAKELADDEVSSAEQALNREIELRNQGYANDVALREKELADAKQKQKEALEMQQKAKKEELAINTAMEASNMAVAIANLFKQFGWYAIPLTAVMLGAWGATKISALNSIKSTKYREGGVMLLEGGSHQSGHDVNLGIGPDGSNLRAEGGEYFAVINKRNSRRYGSEIPNIVNALNSGMFEDRYIKTSDAMGMLPRIIKADDGSAVDLSAVESGVGALVKQGERTWSTEGEYRVMRYKNLTRRVRVG